MSHIAHSVHGPHQFQAKTTDLDKLLQIYFTSDNTLKRYFFILISDTLHLLAWLRMSRVYSVMGPLPVGLHFLTQDYAQQQGLSGIFPTVATMSLTFLACSWSKQLGSEIFSYCQIILVGRHLSCPAFRAFFAG
nr:uncharacterized protein LOC123002428 [Drosophila takahashii]